MDGWIMMIFWSSLSMIVVVLLLLWSMRLALRWCPSRTHYWSSRHQTERPLSYSEAMLLNFKECNRHGAAPLSMVMLITLDRPFLSPARLQAALHALQQRHTVLNARLDAHSRRVSVPSAVPNPSPPLAVSLQSLLPPTPPPSDAQLIEAELNAPLEDALLRCRLLTPAAEEAPSPPHQHQKLLLTIDHILLDGPSLGLLAKELLELARGIVPLQRPALPLPVSSDVWLPALPMPLLLLYAFVDFLLRARFLIPRIRFLPLSNLDPPISSFSSSSLSSSSSSSSSSLSSRKLDHSSPSWSTLIELRALSPRLSQQLLDGCRQHATTMGALLACVSCATVAKQAFEAEPGDDGGQVWLHMTVDMRRMADRVHPDLKEEPVGHHAVFIIDTWMAMAELLQVSRQPLQFWQYAHRQRNEFAANFVTRHRHIANHVIAGWTGAKQREILNTYVKTKRQPKGGTVSLSNLGLISPNDSSLQQSDKPLGSSSQSLLAQAGSREYLFPSASAVSALGILDVRGAVTQSMPSRHVCITSMTMNGSLKLSFSFPDYSVSRQGAIAYANDFVALLESLVPLSS